MSFIECKDLSFSYGKNDVLVDVNFAVEKGDYLCILGDNGAGKSTLLKCLLSLQHVKKGEIVFESNSSKNAVGYLPQQTQVQRDFPASVMEVVLSGCLNSMGSRPFYSPKEKKLAKAMLEKLEILDLEKCCYNCLSGGQQQRVLIARALCAGNACLLLDEPMSGLDVASAARLYGVLQKLNEEGITIIMVTHDIKNAKKYANKILHLSLEQTFFGSVEEYEEKWA